MHAIDGGKNDKTWMRKHQASANLIESLFSQKQIANMTQSTTAKFFNHFRLLRLLHPAEGGSRGSGIPSASSAQEELNLIPQVASIEMEIHHFPFTCILTDDRGLRLEVHCPV